MLDKIAAIADDLGKPECLLADTGHFSAAIVAACDTAAIEPLIAMGRDDTQHPPLAVTASKRRRKRRRSNAGRAMRIGTTAAGRALNALRTSDAAASVFGHHQRPPQCLLGGHRDARSNIVTMA